MLNDRQIELLLRMAKQQLEGASGTGACSPGPTLTALVKRKLLVRFGSYERKEWNKTVATLTTVYCTQQGLEMAAAVAVGRALQNLSI